MDTIGIRALRAELAHVVGAAERGHSTVITVHGRPVAQIAPVVTPAATIEQLIAGGWLHAPRRTGAWRPPPATETVVGTRIDLALRDLRG